MENKIEGFFGYVWYVLGRPLSFGLAVLSVVLGYVGIYITTQLTNKEFNFIYLLLISLLIFILSVSVCSLKIAYDMYHNLNIERDNEYNTLKDEKLRLQNKINNIQLPQVLKVQKEKNCQCTYSPLFNTGHPVTLVYYDDNQPEIIGNGWVSYYDSNDHAMIVTIEDMIDHTDPIIQGFLENRKSIVENVRIKYRVADYIYNAIKGDTDNEENSKSENI